MDRKYTSLGSYIKKTRKEKGLSKNDLAGLMGYRNLNRGSRRITDIESGNIEKIHVVTDVLKALGPDMSQVNQAFADDFITLRKTCFEDWLTSRSEIEQILTSKMCHKCPFFIGSCCHHPVNPEGPRKLKIAKWAGFVRPEWCPLGFPEDYKGHFGWAKSSIVPVSVEIDGTVITGCASGLSPESFRVTIDSPYRGFSKDAPPAFKPIIGDYPKYIKDGSSPYSFSDDDSIMTKTGMRVAREVLTSLYMACRNVEENIDEMTTLYQVTITKLEAADMAGNDEDMNNKRRIIRKEFKLGHIEKKEYDTRLHELRRKQKDEIIRGIIEKESIVKEFHQAAEEVTGLEGCGELLWDIITELHK